MGTRATWMTVVAVLSCACTNEGTVATDAGADASVASAADASQGGAGDAQAVATDGSDDGGRGPSVYDGGGPAMVGDDADSREDAAPATTACTGLTPLASSGECGPPTSGAACPPCAPIAYACADDARPPEVALAGGACFAIGGLTCCTFAACTQTRADNDACADGGLAYYCPSGATVSSLHCATPDAGDPTLACCTF